MEIYCDSSFDDKTKTAGIGIYIIDGEKRRVVSNWIKCRTNNEAELFAIYTAGILGEGKAKIYTDSQTAISYIKGEIKDKPRTNEQYINHKHCELQAYRIRKLGIMPEKVKGHQHNFQHKAMGNRMADLLAKDGIGKFYLTLRDKRVR